MRLLLEQIRDRYFRPVMSQSAGRLCHHADCQTHRAMEVYKYALCTCGLLHDLRMLDGSLASKIYPDAGEEYAKQEAMVPGSFYWMDSEERATRQAEARDFLKKYFGEAARMDAQEWDARNAKDWTLIEEVFGRTGRQNMESNWFDGDGVD